MAACFPGALYFAAPEAAGPFAVADGGTWSPPAQAPDPLGALGLRVTGGAAPGYVEDRACRVCHRARFDGYQEVGMARSFSRVRPEVLIEDFTNARFVHGPSRETLEMRRTDDGLRFRRFQVAPDGTPINVIEQQVDWIVGSGHTSRVYLYRAPNGELYQLPLAWYSQERRWAMAPGFDRPDHLGVTRIVHRECLFCHNAYPDVPAGADARHAPDVFPVDLPEGIGCQRCHGPGAEHTRLAHLGRPGDELRSTIVNPGRLPAERRNAVCEQCHLQPSVAIAGARRFDRGVYSFRPGESLDGYMVHVEADEEGEADGFEINHHAYRLAQSACGTAIESRLGCLTCHDPHRKVPPEDREDHYRQACRVCHQPEACTRPSPAGASRPAGDCVGCHMPRRRTQDVVHVVMTDHRIQRPQGGRDWSAPLAEREPVLVDARLYRAPSAMRPEAELYRALAVARTGASEGATRKVEQLLVQWPTPSLVPYLDLIDAWLRQRQFEAASRGVGVLLQRAPTDTRVVERAGLTAGGLGRRSEALALLRRAVAAAPDRPDLHYSLGQVLLADDSAHEALVQFDRAVALRPNLVIAWYHIGLAYSSLGELTRAADAWRRALTIAPRHGLSYAQLGRALVLLGQVGEARRYLEHGLAVADDRETVAAVLATLP